MDAPEVIEPGRMYSKTEVSRRLRLGAKGWQSLRQHGLRTVRIGRGSFVFADDLLLAIRRRQHGGKSCK